jgi:hypothetical protein
LSHAPIGQGDVDLYEEKEAGEGAALKKAGLGLFGLGDFTPDDALLLGQLPPTGGDGAEIAADRELSGGAGVKGNKRRVAVLAIAVALPNHVPAFA